jgi:GNAT superfamily N-acetyltransferase
MNGANGLDIRVARRAEYAEIEALSRSADAAEVFMPLTEPLIEWFVDENPCGRGFVVIASDREAGLVGHFVFYRWRLRRRVSATAAAVDVPAALYVRLYVDARQRRRGIFAAMTRFGLEQLAAEQVPFAYTAPNPRSSPGFVKFGMTHVGPLPFRLRPKVPGWSWLTGPGPASRRYRAEIRERFDDAFADRFEERLPARVALWSPRAAALLNWRYVDKPDATYSIQYLLHRDTLVGYTVTRRMTIKGQPVVALCDGWTDAGHEPALRVGLDAVMSGANGARMGIAIGAAADPRLTRALARSGLIRCPTALLPQPVAIFGGPVPGAAAGFDAPDEAAWYLTPYDWDVF